jgi:peptidoglycan/xylan/chitin deacetylase (PgdA/CDA1 family)
LRHYNLPTLGSDDLDKAMREGVDELEQVVGYRPTSIGYPHGKADLRVAEAARRAGYEIGVTSTHMVAMPDQNPLLIERVNGWTDSLASFAWTLARLARPS